MAGFIAFGDVLFFVGGVVIGVMFKDKMIWVKDKAMAFYDWIVAKI